MNIIYTKPDCPWCDKAKALLDSYNIKYAIMVYGVDFSREYLEKLLPVGSKVTVPQIVMNGKRIGGYEDLVAYFEQTGIFGLQN
jgi:glutaredoxin 3